MHGDHSRLRSGGHYSLPLVRRVTVSPAAAADLTLELQQARPAWLRIRAQETGGSRPCVSPMQLHLYPAVGVGTQLGRRQQAAVGARTAVEIFAGIPYAVTLDSPDPACSTWRAARRESSWPFRCRNHECPAAAAAGVWRPGAPGTAPQARLAAQNPHRSSWGHIPARRGCRALRIGPQRCLSRREPVREGLRRSGLELAGEQPVESLASWRREGAGQVPEVETPEPRLARREPCNFERWGLVTEPPVRINGWPGVPAGAGCAASR